MKIVINNTYGGWGISKNFYEHYDIPYKEEWGVAIPKKTLQEKIPD